ncbi:uncharacterized protein LOC135329410 isoform X2 [Dromaius novaehollandiae]
MPTCASEQCRYASPLLVEDKTRGPAVPVHDGRCAAKPQGASWQPGPGGLLPLPMDGFKSLFMESTEKTTKRVVLLAGEGRLRVRGRRQIPPGKRSGRCCSKAFLGRDFVSPRSCGADAASISGAKDESVRKGNKDRKVNLAAFSPAGGGKRCSRCRLCWNAALLADGSCQKEQFGAWAVKRGSVVPQGDICGSKGISHGFPREKALPLSALLGKRRSRSVLTRLPSFVLGFCLLFNPFHYLGGGTEQPKGSACSLRRKDRDISGAEAPASPPACPTVLPGPRSPAPAPRLAPPARRCTARREGLGLLHPETAFAGHLVGWCLVLPKTRHEARGPGGARFARLPRGQRGEVPCKSKAGTCRFEHCRRAALPLPVHPPAEQACNRPTCQAGR